MPTVPKTSPRKIVEAARALIERDGLALFTMQAVAEAVGIRTPSLYRHFTDRGAIVRVVSREVVEQMRQELESAACTNSPVGDLRAIAHAQRRFALEKPRLYALVFDRTYADLTELEPETYAGLVATLLDRLRPLPGPGQLLDRARMFVALVHGFSTMEANGSFRLGGDVQRAFAFAVDRMLASLTAPEHPESESDTVRPGSDRPRGFADAKV